MLGFGAIGGNPLGIVTIYSAGPVSLSADLFSNNNGFYGHTVTQGGSTQTLTQSSSFQNSNSFYAPTVTPGSFSLAASLFSSSNSFYNHIVSSGGFALQQDIRLDNVNSFYGIEVTTGQVSLAADLFNNSNLFYGAVVSTGGFVLQQTSRFDNSGDFYEINVAVGSVTLTVNLFTNSNTFFTHTISQASLLELTQSVRFDNTNNFYVAAIGAGTTLTPADIALIMSAMRIEFATELARIDVAISSRLASADYIAPDNVGIAALPTLAEIESSTVLAKEGTVATLNDISVADILAAASTTPIAANVKEVNDTVVKGSGTELDPWGPV